MGIVLTSRELVAVPPEVGVTGETIERVTPAGRTPIQVGVNVTSELKPFIEPTITVTDTS